MRTTRSILAAAAILAWSAPHIYAQIGSSLTGKTITMIVGFAPGRRHGRYRPVDRRRFHQIPSRQSNIHRKKYPGCRGHDVNELRHAAS